ncbi:Fructose dehydrogenase cytochrome subunit [Pseudomonas extremaustralis]|uniref:Fructose dehydrogenase cytochrome subunit n=2 Tax=Pseudomonas extremaustralis TaxID=359110 RepID=A0A5M9IXJ7_9PSED|nr:Fructose dehydrogenase cytochrome subunit [Pseudomonas extremaustralis]
MPRKTGKGKGMRHALAGVLTLVVCMAGNAQGQALDTTASPGKRLAVAADCVACHTSPGGKPFAGGYPLSSPMGVIYSTNITPSMSAGIGAYTAEQFARAVRDGVTPDGTHLYPAMPYTSYAKMTDADVAELYHYFMHEVQPVDAMTQKTRLDFPFSIRASMLGWNALFHSQKRFTPDPGKSAEVNRGDYLVNALAHCDTCHTPRNVLMAADNSKPLAGGALGSWYAPNITSDKTSGIGAWSSDELVAYLRTGHVEGKAQAAGPMAEAVEHSLQYLDEVDLKAIAAYLLQTPPINTGETKARHAFGQASTDELTLRGGKPDANAGWHIFSGTCANCHQANGQGTREYPSLFHNTAASRSDNLIAAIVYGVHREVDGVAIDMPAFGPDALFTDRLNDQQIADVSNYVLSRYGNDALVVTAADVAQVREGGPKAPLAVVAKFTLPAILVACILIALVVILFFRRRRREV